MAFAASVFTPAVLISFLTILWVGILAFMVSRLTQRIKAFEDQWSDLLTGSAGDDLGDSLEKLLKDQSEARTELAEIRKSVDLLRMKIETSKRFYGVKRYDAFDEMSGEQSFALALYDDRGDGFLLSCQTGRDSARVFAKTISSGETDPPMTFEERAAFSAASRSGAKAP